MFMIHQTRFVYFIKDISITIITFSIQCPSSGVAVHMLRNTRAAAVPRQCES